MKRFYNYFLSLFLLTLVGIVGASAQIVQEGARITTEDAVAGKEILLRTMGSFGSNGYLSGQGYSATVTKDCVYTLEATGKTVDGHKTYVLKRVSTGLYLQDPLVDGVFNIKDEDTSNSPYDGHMTAYTADKSAAMEVTCLLAVNDGTDDRSKATTGNGQDLSQPCFVLCRAEFVESKPVYFGHYYEPFYSIYVDTNAWQIYQANSPVGMDLLYAVNTAYFSAGDPLDSYPHGTAPGQYKESLVQAAHALYVELQDAINAGKVTNEAAADLGNRIVAAMDALNSDKAYNGWNKGFYYIYNVSGRTLYSQEVGSTEFLYASKNDYARPTTGITVDDVKYIWEVVSAPAADGTVVIRNAATGSHLSGVKAAISTGADDGYGFTLTADGVVKVAEGSCKTATGKTFTFSSTLDEPGGNGHAMYHAKYDNKVVMGWNAAEAENNNFYFSAVSADEVADVMAKAQQDARNSKLSSLYSSIVVAMNNGYTQTSTNGTNKDDSFESDSRALVHDVQQWYTPNLDATEGKIEALSDGVCNDPSAEFFHTDWHSSNGAGFTPSLLNNHFLVASIPDGVTGGLDVKFAKRINASNGQMLDYPTVFAIYGSNDFDEANPTAATWTLQGISNVNFKDSIAVVTPAGDTKKPAIGIASVKLDGTYHAIKLAVLGTDQGRGYWSVSELNLWQADVTEQPTPEFADVQKNAPQTIEAVNAELAKAEAELNAEKATQAQIDALTKAYAEFRDNYPNPQRVTDAYTAAKTFLDNAKSNGLVGPSLAQYPSAASDALNAVLDKYKDFEEVSLSAINAAVEEINAALATFKASIKLPEANKYYVIRSASRKVSDGGSQYNASVYSRNTSIARNADTGQGGQNDGGLWLIRQQNSDTITAETSDISGLKDTLSPSTDLRQVWKAESSANGKIVLRNMATGMYLKGENGYMSQSTTPVEVAVEGIKANTFRFNAGTRAGKTWYMNAKRLWGKVVTWTDATDQNSNWTITEIRDNEISKGAYYLENAVKSNYYIATLPFDVANDGDILPYEIIGVNADNQLVLAESDDDVPAGTPFIFSVESIRANVATPTNKTVGLAKIVLADKTSAEFTYDVKEANGLKGTLTEEKEIGNGRSYLLNNKVVATTGDNTYTVPVNSGYFGYVAPTEEGGDATIDIEKAAVKNLTGISESNVVVLPSVVDVYSIDGTLVRKGVKSTNAAKNLPAGLYIIGGQKVIVK